MPQIAESRDQVKHKLATDVLRTTGKVCLAAFGYSMLPTIWPGDLLTIEARSLEQIRVGDVVLFSREDRFFIHRVVDTFDANSGRCLIARGDALPDDDAAVLPEQVLGKVTVLRRSDRDIEVPACSTARRLVGLLLTASGRLRSLTLRWHAWHSPAAGSKSKLAPESISLG